MATNTKYNQEVIYTTRLVKFLNQSLTYFDSEVSHEGCSWLPFWGLLASLLKRAFWYSLQDTKVLRKDLILNSSLHDTVLQSDSCALCERHIKQQVRLWLEGRLDCVSSHRFESLHMILLLSHSPCPVPLPPLPRKEGKVDTGWK